MSTFKVTGLDGVVRSLDKAIEYLADDIAADLNDWGNDVVKEARRTHKFGRPYSKGYKTRSGNGDRSITHEVKGTQVRLYVDPDHVSVKSKKHGSFNYIWAQHDGTKRGIKADPFLLNAAKNKSDELVKKILKSVKRIMG